MHDIFAEFYSFVEAICEGLFSVMHRAWTAIKFLRWDFKGTMAYQEEKCLVVQCPLFWNCWLLYDIKVALQHWKGSNHTVKWKYNCCNRNFLVLENIRTRVSSFSDPTTKNKTMQVNKVLSYIHFHSAPPILVRTELTVIRTIGIAWKTVENGKKKGFILTQMGPNVSK